MPTISTIAELREIHRACTVEGVFMVRDIIKAPDKIRVVIHDGKEPYYFTIWNSTVADTFVTDVIPTYIYRFELYVDNKGKGTFVRQVLGWAMQKESDELSRRFKSFSINRISDTNRNLFLNCIKDIQNPSYRRLVELAYGVGVTPMGINSSVYRKRREDSLIAWGSINRHDSYPGGYVNHIMDMIRIACKLRGMYEDPSHISRMERSCNFDWDYLITLIYLHDIGKQDTYDMKQDGTIRWKRHSRLDHEELSAMKIYSLVQEMEPNLRVSEEDMHRILNSIRVHGEADAMRNSKYKLSPEDKMLMIIDAADSILVDQLVL